jgi:hypothetical protein
MGSSLRPVGNLADSVRRSWHDLQVSPAARWRALASIGVAVVFASAIAVLLGPLFQSMSTFGFHDWDSHSAYRYATVASIKRYHQFPWWDPWMGGGFPAWAYVEGATNFVSPYVLFYLTLPIQVAERCEILGATLTGLVSAYWLAGRVTRSAALRALVAVAYAINGRWALQVSTGHSWHMQYAWLPLAVFFLDLSFEPGKRRYALASGGVLAIIVYMGGIYPLPHAAVLLVLYGLTYAVVERRWQPIRELAVASSSGIGFAAPKLFPMIELMRRYPRKIDSPEAIDLGQLTVMLTERNQSYAQAPIAVPRWGWHEYGIYVGSWVVLAMILGLIGSRARKSSVFKLSGLAFLFLGMGAFHSHAPWTLLHQLPVFSSQHVPSRFLFTAILMLMLAFAAFAGGAVDRALASRGWLDLLLLVPVFFVAIDIATVGRRSTEHSFYMEAPVIHANPVFQQRNASPYNYAPGDWAGATLLAMFANIGIIGSYGLPPFQPGALAATTPEYRGEAYLADGVGSAHVAQWTPNRAVVEYDHAGAGSVLVYNMNFDPGWSANGAPALDYHQAVAAHVPIGSGRVTFSYYPPMLNWGLLVFALTVGLSVATRKTHRSAPADRRGALVPERAPVA